MNALIRYERGKNTHHIRTANGCEPGIMSVCVLNGLQVTVPVNCSACSSFIVQTRFDLKPFAHFEKERESAHGHSRCL